MGIQDGGRVTNFLHISEDMIDAQGMIFLTAGFENHSKHTIAHLSSMTIYPRVQNDADAVAHAATS